MLGNEAVVRGAWGAGVQVAATYPGTPSTEIVTSLARYDGVYAERSTNEKVAYEVALPLIPAAAARHSSITARSRIQE